MTELRKRGVSATVICSDPFLGMAKTQLRVFGAPDLPLVIIPHPLGGLSLADVKKRADAAIRQVVALFKEQTA